MTIVYKDKTMINACTRLLWCDNCKTWTNHTLNASKTRYICACGSEVVYIIKPVE